MSAPLPDRVLVGGEGGPPLTASARAWVFPRPLAARGHRARFRGRLGSMPTRLVHVVADALDPPRLARFWAGLLGWEIADETADEVDVWPAGYTYPDPVAVP